RLRPVRVATATRPTPRDDRYKWVALTNTTVGVLLATIDASIMLIAMPDIFRGIQQNIGPISLSSVYEDTDVPLDSLTEFDRQTVEGTINAGSLQEAEQIVSNLRTTAGGGG
ncbi:MAG: hypothetical protein J0I44_08995, partial [Microbacterium sp.]|nr:hypothetical protein [Microbacterium sp.]